MQNTTAKLYFYPAETSSVSRTLTGRRAVAGYGSPHIIKQDKLTLSNSDKLKKYRKNMNHMINDDVIMELNEKYGKNYRITIKHVK